jgi:hypothetical protein
MHPGMPDAQLSRNLKDRDGGKNILATPEIMLFLINLVGQNRRDDGNNEDVGDEMAKNRRGTASRRDQPGKDIFLRRSIL